MIYIVGTFNFEINWKLNIILEPRFLELHEWTQHNLTLEIYVSYVNEKQDFIYFHQYMYAMGDQKLWMGLFD